MTTKKMQSNYNKAVDFIHSVMWGECMCGECIFKRQQKSLPDAVAIFYPKLSVMPKQWDRDIQSNGAVYILQLAFSLMETNAQISKTRNTEDKIRERSKKTLLYFCRNCGLLHLTSQMIHDEHYCPKCYDSLCECGMCGDIMPRRRATTARIKGQKIRVCYNCRKKLSYCTNCGYMVEKESVVHYDMRRFEDGSMEQAHICKECDPKHSFTCKCGIQTHNQVSRRSSNGDQVCPACSEEDEGMQPYYFKPMRLHFQTGDREGKVSEDAFHMGFEIEIAMKYSNIDQNSMTHLLKEKFGNKRIYCMHDGTIESSSGYPGLEVVSHPFTWEDYKEQSYKWDEMLIYLRAKGWSANFPGVGFHVHTTKESWGSFQIYKLLQLIYKNKDWACKIAQRKPTTYCTMETRDFDEAVLVAKNKKNRSVDHYSAINLNNGNGTASKTIEFRLFQGNLEPLYFHKNIEFVRACYQYTQNYRDMTIGGFTAYVRKNNREYPCLNEFLNMKGL